MAKETNGESVPRNTNTTVATIADLQSLRREIHEELSGIRTDLGTFQKEITYQLTRRSETNWGTVFTGLSVCLLMLGMSATLIWSLIGSEREARMTGDVALFQRQTEIEKRQDGNVEENRDEIESVDEVMQREMRLLDEVLQREMGLHVDRLDQLIDVNIRNLERNEDAIRRIEELMLKQNNGVQ